MELGQLAQIDTGTMRGRRGIPPNAQCACYLEKHDPARNVDKFWSAWVINSVGVCLVVRWGRRGSRGQQNTFRPLTADAALADYRERVQAKLNAGYLPPDTGLWRNGRPVTAAEVAAEISEGLARADMVARYEPPARITAQPHYTTGSTPDDDSLTRAYLAAFERRGREAVARMGEESERARRARQRQDFEEGSALGRATLNRLRLGLWYTTCAWGCGCHRCRNAEAAALRIDPLIRPDSSAQRPIDRLPAGGAAAIETRQAAAAEAARRRAEAAVITVTTRRRIIVLDDE